MNVGSRKLESTLFQGKSQDLKRKSKSSLFHGKSPDLELVTAIDFTAV